MKSLPFWKRWWTTTHTGYALLCIVILSLGALGRSARWQRFDVITWDTGGYYAYLVSAFVTHDIGSGTELAAVRTIYRPDLNSNYGMVPLSNGNTVFKYPIGMALTFAPWFAVGSGYALLTDEALDGYSMPYQFTLALGCLIYAMLGLWLLGRKLRHYFPDHLTALTPLCVGPGTNLFCYATYEAAMPHGTLLLLNVLLVRYTRK